MTDDEIDALVGLNDQEFDKNFLKARKNGLLLTDNQVETLEKKGSLQDLVKCWLEIYSFLNHIRKLDLDISYEELLYGISEMKPIMDNFFHENNIQEWSSMSYSQMYQFDYYLCNFMIKIYGYERIKLLKAIINNSFVHVKKVE